MSLYLVTGGAGFIGSHLAIHLAQAGHDVRIFDNFSGGVPRAALEERIGAFSQRVQIVEGDVRDISDCRRACIGASFILHHAAISSTAHSLDDPGLTLMVNTVGAANMLQAAVESESVKRFVNASSCAIYGDGPSASTSESSTPNPRSPYATSMLAAEHLCMNVFRNQGLPTLSLRYFNVYGPDESLERPSASVIAKFIHAARTGAAVVINGDGEQTRDFIHVADAVDACLSACNASERTACGQAFNVGTGKRVTVRDALATIGKYAQAKFTIETAPAGRHEIRYSRADIIKTAGALQFTPAVIFEHGIAQMLDAMGASRAA